MATQTQAKDGLASRSEAGRPGILVPMTCLKLHGVHGITIAKKVQDGWTTVALRKGDKEDSTCSLSTDSGLSVPSCADR